ncbi:MAG: PQQ-binding-like beta-propeller repeat protein [Saprospiraceae bacterium]|nr:PQQ-binding-like beta-propeller repeat protein [Saprospiraceae bacterium]MCF8249365.1 PQQ-binding-like beta-propeller repeat protein [Saprospiraceae bacterium]MCF8279017.1 PQQ-binding-like beta-propeller repeat protein [Bacteroidales bacterium]MCF8311494.1 PQQ-binding-like beta-propeller repeat protein [Saprospiraceae bacterium]MCF8439984.1 PQQ-binding-like beta-propeller repeat protein [Saprospiraceae bacterium]
MNRAFFSCFVITLLGFNCKKDDGFEKKDKSGIIVNKSFLWKKPLTANQFIWSGSIQLPIFEDKYITATHFESNAKLAALDIFTGETKWEWNDYLGKDQDTIFLDLLKPYYYGNILIFQKGPRSYCIDMANGQTVWKRSDNQSFQTYLTGTRQEFLARGTEGPDTLGYEIEYDYIGNIHNGEKYPLNYPSFELITDNDTQIAMRSTGGNLFEANGKQYFLSTYVKFADHWIALPFLALYNRTDKKWEYAEKQILPPHLRNAASNFPIISEDIVITSIGNHICANELWTGDSIWAYDCGGNFEYGGFLVHDGRIYAMAEANALYCFDLYTGQVIWKQDYDGLGTTSRMSHLNGVLYFSSGGSGTLMAVDMATGKIIWNLESPDGGSYKEVSVYPGKDGKKPLILTATYQNAYCYEAVR